MNQHPNTHQVGADATAGAGVGSRAGQLSEAALARLVARIRTGDREALGELYRETRPAVTRYLTKRMEVCRDDVEDVVQETYLRAPEMADTFQSATTEVGAWICGRVAHWTMADHFRKQRFAQHSAKDAAIDAARRAPFVSAHERESRPLSSRMVTALARLTPAQRRAVQLRYLDGHSNETAAEVAESTPQALAQNALAARKRLRTELSDLAPQPVSWVATLPKTMAVTAALAETSNDVPAALAWLRERGVEVNESYVYQIRKGAREPRQNNAKETAVRDALARLGACDAATVQAQLREHGIEVSKGYINTVRRDTGTPRPINKNTVVRNALAELDTTDAGTVQAHLRERGIEVSKSYINQVRRTPTATTPAATAEPANTAGEVSRAARVDTSASNQQTAPAADVDGIQVGGVEAADKATAAIARARVAVARIPAARAHHESYREPTRLGGWRGRDLSRDTASALATSGSHDQLEVSA